jgi:hypothetical protein
MTMHDSPSGPEYLQSLADQVSDDGQGLTADHLRRMSRAWSADQQALQDAHDENTRMQARLTKAAQALGEAA